MNVGTQLLRVYAPAPYGVAATSFRGVGPMDARFDHHRGSRHRPADDGERGVLYAARTLVCALGERFGDVGAITFEGHRIAALQLRTTVTLLDLRGTAARAAGTIPAIGMVGERDVTQAWSRWWYEQPELGEVGGLLYSSAQTGSEAVALWERCASALRAVGDWPLEAEEIRSEIEVAADELRLPIL
jgi:hypothetical protein